MSEADWATLLYATYEIVAGIVGVYHGVIGMVSIAIFVLSAIRNGIRE